MAYLYSAQLLKMRSERELLAENLVESIVLGELKTKIPQVETYFRGDFCYSCLSDRVEECLDDFKKILEINSRNTPCFFTSDVFSEIPKNIKELNDPDVCNLVGDWSIAVSADNLPLSDRELIILEKIAGRHNKDNVKLSDLVVWVKFAHFYTMDKDNMKMGRYNDSFTREILGLDELVIEDMKEKVVDKAVEDSRSYRSLESSPYDNYDGITTYNTESYERQFEKYMNDWVNKNECLIKRFKLEGLVGSYSKERVNYLPNAYFHINPNATPGINHATGLPYY